MTTEYRVPILDKWEWQEPVLDKDLTSPPGGLLKGDRYLIYGIGAGNWAGQDGNIVEYDGFFWFWIPKREGMIVYVKDEDIWYRYITSWDVFVGGSGLSHPQVMSRVFLG